MGTVFCPWLESEVEVLMAQLCLTLCDPMNCSPPGSSAREFCRQEYWNGLPFPSAGNLPDPGIELQSLALQADSLPSEPPGNPLGCINSMHSGPKYSHISCIHPPSLLVPGGLLRACEAAIA